MISLAVKASYTPSKIPRMQGNPFIEALPPSLSDDEALACLTLKPDFSPQQRDWENHERIQQIKSLSNIMVPLTCHLELARNVDAKMREGYVGRRPRTKQMVAALQAAYALQKEGRTFSQSAQTLGPRDSAALIGVPGMGKSTTIIRWFSQYPRVIDHGDGVLQIPYVHVDMASSGTSVKSLAIAIISQIDQLVPECGYAKLYLQSATRKSTEDLIHAAGRLVALHYVGLVVADEIQNLSGAKGVQTVMTELVTMCNTFSVPLLFIGTNKALNILGADFRSARRAIGGLAPWKPLPRYDDEYIPEGENFSEWADFMGVLWKYQWVKTPVELTEDLLDYLHDRTQGIIDLAIKIFAIAQVRAISSGLETLSEDLFEQVYQTDFMLLHGVLEAMRGGDQGAFSKFADVKPLDLECAIEDHLAQARMRQRRRRALKAGQDGFVEAVGAALVALGVEVDDASKLAIKANQSDGAATALDAVGKIAKEQRPSRAKGKSSTAAGTVISVDFSSRPNDYRRAFALAKEQSTKVLDQLKNLGMVRPVEELVPLV